MESESKKDVPEGETKEPDAGTDKPLSVATSGPEMDTLKPTRYKRHRNSVHMLSSFTLFQCRYFHLSNNRCTVFLYTVH